MAKWTMNDAFDGLNELTERKRRVLWAIVQDYSSTAEPVGSRTIARKYDLGVSSATIRNEMQDLEMKGILNSLILPRDGFLLLKGTGTMWIGLCSRLL